MCTMHLSILTFAMVLQFGEMLLQTFWNPYRLLLTKGYESWPLHPLVILTYSPCTIFSKYWMSSKYFSLKLENFCTSFIQTCLLISPLAYCDIPDLRKIPFKLKVLKCGKKFLMKSKNLNPLWYLRELSKIFSSYQMLILVLLLYP